MLYCAPARSSSGETWAHMGHSRSSKTTIARLAPLGGRRVVAMSAGPATATVAAARINAKIAIPCFAKTFIVLSPPEPRYKALPFTATRQLCLVLVGLDAQAPTPAYISMVPEV